MSRPKVMTTHATGSSKITEKGRVASILTELGLAHRYEQELPVIGPQYDRPTLGLSEVSYSLPNPYWFGI